MTALLVDLGVILVLIAGIAQFRTPRGARHGNLTAAAALLIAVVVVLYRHQVLNVPLVVIVALLGSSVGAWIAARVNMIQIPAMVAFQHGAGGVAAFLVSFVELTRHTAVPPARTAEVAALLGLVVGAATFSGSMIASGKLANRLRQTPTILPGHNWLLVANLAVMVVLAVWAGVSGSAGVMLAASLALIVCAIVLGVVFSIRIGGADMPVLISFLNATAGLAAAFCGIAIGNRLLIACGATVAASGSILTHVMCQAMNRGLVGVFAGLRPHVDRGRPAVRASATAPAAAVAEPVDPSAQAAAALRGAQRVIIIPGYGMALAEASEEVVRLGERLTELGKDVRFAIHPVAGRMPGHMHVLLAEADVDYGQLRELKDVNDQFAETDVALIVGACDVVNPAAIADANTPISGMPILRADEARQVIVCNLDERPGYSGVPNPLYQNPKTILLFGDAAETVSALRRNLETSADGAPGDSAPVDEQLAKLSTRGANLLSAAQRVIIIPGYGMALAEASEEVVRLGERLTELGKDVLFAIHPVAGRMPGHMHVLLAEADVDYGRLRELKDVNDQFTQTDVALIVGACDVVNPAAIADANTPISGMPILRADEARHIIVCNLDERPGYSGVPNPLYQNPKTILLFGDAAETVSALRRDLENTSNGATGHSATTRAAGGSA